jgi:hypothetical protein
MWYMIAKKSTIVKLIDTAVLREPARILSSMHTIRGNERQNVIHPVGALKSVK